MHLRWWICTWCDDTLFISLGPSSSEFHGSFGFSFFDNTRNLFNWHHICMVWLVRCNELFKRVVIIMLITIPFQYVAFRIFVIVALTIPLSSINISTLISFCSVIVLFIITTSWYENAFLITGPFWVLTFCGCPIERAINMFFFRCC